MRALISVSDKTGMVELAQELSKAGIEIISTGGTAKALQQAEIDTVEIGSYTGFPELLEGRLKTLHPKVFGGLLYIRNNPKHASEAEKHDIPSIDWVIVNLYPFERIHMENKIPKSEMIEFVDIGGPSLLRAGSKNFQDVVVLCDHADYGPTIQEFKETGKVSFETRKKLAGKAFAHTAHYDSMIAKFFSRGGPDDRVKTEQPANPFPVEFSVGLKKVSDLRYGENPHQKAALYKESGDREWGVVNAEKEAFVPNKLPVSVPPESGRYELGRNGVPLITSAEIDAVPETSNLFETEAPTPKTFNAVHVFASERDAGPLV
jgi:phosphoribosylaminoimidazolecarboxamide formyltransferase/IMP cyclohydrolase